MNDAFADLIYTNTSRSFYALGPAEEFAAAVAERGYNYQLFEHCGEDLRWEVKVVGKKIPEKKK